MIKLFFLLPIIMCGFWWWYITSKGYRVKEAKSGFIYIISFNALIISFFVLMMYLTDSM